MANNGQLDNVGEGLANQLLSMDPNISAVLELLSVTMMQRGDLPSHSIYEQGHYGIWERGSTDSSGQRDHCVAERLDAKAPILQCRLQPPLSLKVGQSFWSLGHWWWHALRCGQTPSGHVAL